MTDGILRKADLPIVDTILCQEYLDVNARSDEMHSGFICAGGKGSEESCYVSNDKFTVNNNLFQYDLRTKALVLAKNQKSDP